MNKSLKDIIKKNPNIGKGCNREAEYLSTGFPTLDTVLGGGWAKGTFIELWGIPSCGKTSLMLQNAIDVLKADGKVVWFDTEHALSKFKNSFKKALGLDVDNENFIYIEPKEGTHDTDLQSIIEMARTGEIRLIVVDSIARLEPKTSSEKKMGKQERASLPKFLKQFLNRMIDVLADKETVLVMVNQITADMSKSFATQTTPGGYNPKFVAWARVRLHSFSEETDSSGKPLGWNRVTAVVKKTRGGRPHLDTTLRFDYDKGFNKTYDVLQQKIKSGEIVQAGSWYKIGKRSFQGEEKVLKYLEEKK